MMLNSLCNSEVSSSDKSIVQSQLSGTFTVALKSFIFNLTVKRLNRWNLFMPSLSNSSTTASSVPVFLAKPSVVLFTEYSVGQVYEVRSPGR